MGTANERVIRGRKLRPLITLAAGTAAALGVITAAALSGAAVQDAAAPHQVTFKRMCAVPTRSGQMACDLLLRTDSKGVRAAAMTVAGATPRGYGPSSLRSAYNLTATGDSRETVAVVDAFDDPNAESDLDVYRARYGLPACTTANGCFRKVNQTGGTAYPSAARGREAGWAGEIAADLDMVSAIAPDVHILLVEANDDQADGLNIAQNEAVALGARFIVDSWGGTESPTEATEDSKYFDHPGVAIVAAAGDDGFREGVSYPASSPYVTAVGGTTLSTASNARGWTESVWGTSATEGTDSGCSAYEPKPSWQTDSGCSHRMTVDVSAVANPATGVAIYDTYDRSGWADVGGTSVAAPIIAGVYALAGIPGSADYPDRDPYLRSSSLYDVTSGSNGSCRVAYFCTAEAGYDGPTGLGTPDGDAAFTAATRTLPGSWTECAAEGGTCAVSSSSVIAFGAGGEFKYAAESSSTACTVATFGDPDADADPASGVGQACYLETAPSATDVWQRCAAEGGTCSFSGVMTVAFGANGSYSYATLSGGTACGVAIFGGQAVGTGRSCYVVGAPPTPRTWTDCSAENETCSFTGTHEVAFGANGHYQYASLTGGTSCGVAVFGDPAVGTSKTCYVQ